MNENGRVRRAVVVSSIAVLLASLAMLMTALLWRDAQERRAEAIRTSCAQTNERHDKTIAELDRLIADIPPGTRRRARAERGRSNTVALIEALAPKLDCEKRVEQLK